MADISYYRCQLAWAAGVKAANAGKHISTNNRERGTVYFDDWSDGFLSVANTWPDDKYERLTAASVAA